MRFLGYLCTTFLVLLCSGAANAATPIKNCMSITKPGSYILANNLIATGDCLTIAANHVSVDLGGFIISGNGTGSGISDQGAREDIVIHDGSVTGFSGGIYFCGLGSKAIVVYRVRANNNSQGVVLCDGYAIVKETMANENLAQGIFAGPGSVVTGNVTNKNGSLGLQVGAGSTVIGNTADENGTVGFTGGTGLTVNRGSTVMNNSARMNLAFGLVVECPVNVLGNTIIDNPVNFAPTGGGCNLEHNLLVP